MRAAWIIFGLQLAAAAGPSATLSLSFSQTGGAGTGSGGSSPADGPEPTDVAIARLLDSCAAVQSSNGSNATATCSSLQPAALSQLRQKCPSALGANASLENDTLASACTLWPYLQTRTIWVVGDQQATELWAALLCMLAPYRVGQPHPMAIDPLSSHLFQHYGAHVNPGTCHDLQNRTQLCLLTLDTSEQVVQAGLPWLRNYMLSLDDVIITGFEVAGGRADPSRRHLQEYADQYAIFHKAFPHVLWRQQGAFPSDEMRVLARADAAVVRRPSWWPPGLASGVSSPCAPHLWAHAVALTLADRLPRTRSW